MTPTAPAPSATNFNIALTGNTHREQPAIYAWQLIDPGVVIQTYDVPGDGRFIVAARVTGTGPYTYEYAVHNLNSHRCGGSFIVPLPGAQGALSNVGFHDVEYVGEPNGAASLIDLRLSRFGCPTAWLVSWASVAKCSSALTKSSRTGRVIRSVIGL